MFVTVDVRAVPPRTVIASPRATASESVPSLIRIVELVKLAFGIPAATVPIVTWLSVTVTSNPLAPSIVKAESAILTVSVPTSPVIVMILAPDTVSTYAFVAASCA